MPKCPFYPNDVSPCSIRDCQFRCVGGCAILLAASAYDALQENKKINQEISHLQSNLNNLEYKISQLKCN